MEWTLSDAEKAFVDSLDAKVLKSFAREKIPTFAALRHLSDGQAHKLGLKIGDVLRLRELVAVTTGGSTNTDPASGTNTAGTSSNHQFEPAPRPKRARELPLVDYEDYDDDDEERGRRDISIRAKNASALLDHGVISDPFRIRELLPGVWEPFGVSAVVDRWRVLLPNGNPHVWEELEFLVALSAARRGPSTEAEGLLWWTRATVLLGKLRFPGASLEVAPSLHQKMVAERERLTDPILFKIAGELYRGLEAARTKGTSSGQNNNQQGNKTNQSNNQQGYSHQKQYQPHYRFRQK